MSQFSLFFSHLSPTMVYLLTTLRGRDRDRATAFTTIGLIAVAVEQHIKPYLPKIMEIIKSSLPTKVSKIHLNLIFLNGFLKKEKYKNLHVL